MKDFEIIKPEYDFSELEKPFNLVNEVTSALIDIVNIKRENQIIEALKHRDYTFQNKDQLHEFAKRCTIISYTYNDKKELWYEKELICIWDDKFYFEQKDNGISITLG